MINYIDSSALIKFYSTNQESTEVSKRFGSLLATSVIAKTEIAMYLRRKLNEGISQPLVTLPDVMFMPLTSRIVEFTETLDFKHNQRALDALHLASAYSLGTALNQVITYDNRMKLGATSIGLRVLGGGGFFS